MKKITPFLWFDDDAEAAAEFYCSVFPGSHKISELRSTSEGPGPVGSLIAIDLQLLDQTVTFLNGGPSHQLSAAFSFTVRCRDQAEIDHYWAVLTQGGEEIGCGWLKDKFGMCWQIVPDGLYDLLRHPAAMKAMMAMVKFDVAALHQAARS